MSVGIDGAELATLVGFAGTMTGMVWPLFRSRVAILIAQAASNVFFTIHYLLLGADTAAVLSLVSCLQAAAAIPLGARPGFRIVYLATLPVIAVLLGATWHGLPSAFAALGMAVVSLGRYQTNLIALRVVLLFAGPFWFSHNLLVQSYPGMATDIVGAVLNVIVLFRGFAGPLRVEKPETDHEPVAVGRSLRILPE